MKKIFLIILTVGLLFSQCTSDFEDINTNPNSPDVTPITNVFAYTITTLSGRFGVTEMEYAGSFCGHISRSTYLDAIRYNVNPDIGFWDYMYTNILGNINLVIDQAKKDENPILQGAAMVLRAYAFQMLVDTYGPVPYSEAGLGGIGNTSPKFDKEADIYKDLLEQLNQANTMLVPGTGKVLGIGDVIFGGDISKWKKFCNSLRLRIAIRMSNVDPQTAKTVISEIFNNPDKYPVLSSRSDDVALKYTGTGTWIEPWTYTFSQGQYKDFRVAKPLVDTMKYLSDPRLPMYASVSKQGGYVGLVIGAKTNGSESTIDSAFVFNTAGSTYFLKFTEVEFIRAEAVARGFISGSAADMYKNAITASMDEYGISSDEINAYLANPTVAWNNDIKRLYFQKWLSLFNQCWEAYAEMRRTDVPALPPATESTKPGHNRPPFRWCYPSTEKNLNTKNIPAEVNEVDIYWGYQIWWDTRKGVN
jgi:hypothetical protein